MGHPRRRNGNNGLERKHARRHGRHLHQQPGHRQDLLLQRAASPGSAFLPHLLQHKRLHHRAADQLLGRHPRMLHRRDQLGAFHHQRRGGGHQRRRRIQALHLRNEQHTHRRQQGCGRLENHRPHGDGRLFRQHRIPPRLHEGARQRTSSHGRLLLRQPLPVLSRTLQRTGIASHDADDGMLLLPVRRLHGLDGSTGAASHQSGRQMLPIHVHLLLGPGASPGPARHDARPQLLPVHVPRLQQLDERPGPAGHNLGQLLL